jgi:hypothetical protein
MEAMQAVQIYGLFAYVSAAATIVTLITGFLFFVVSPSYGKLNDASSVFQVLSMIPLAALFYQLLPPSLRVLGLFTALLGLSGLLVSAFGQSLLVLDRIDYEGSRRFFPAGAAAGIWLILSCSFAAGSGYMPQLLALLGIVAGIGFVTTVIGFLGGEELNILFYGGALLLGVSYPIWALWFGYILVFDTMNIPLG